MRTVIAVLALLLVLDSYLLYGHPLARVTTVSLERAEIFNAMAAYEKEFDAPPLLLLGSSLVTAPVLQAEALHHGKPIPRFLHRRSHVLERELGSRLGTRVKVFCLAVGGEMASDAYLIAKHLRQSRKLPLAIVYGAAPRDFQDNLLPGVDASETFQCLAGLDELQRFMTSPSLSIDKKISLLLGRIWTLWRYKSDIHTYLVLRVKKLMEKALPFVVFEKYGQTAELKPRKRGQFPEEAKGVPTAFPGVSLEKATTGQVESEYRRRYNPPSAELIETQFGYFGQLLALCQSAGIPLIVTNMPLSQANKRLMPKALHDNYSLRVPALCRQYNADYFDFAAEVWGREANFVDTVHLSPEVSRPFLSELSTVIARSRVAGVLRHPGCASVHHPEGPLI